MWRSGSRRSDSLPQQPQRPHAKREQMGLLARDRGFPPPGVEAGEKLLLAGCGLCVAGSKPAAWCLGWCPLDEALQTPGTWSATDGITQRMHEYGRGDPGRVERRSGAQQVDAVVRQGLDPGTQTDRLLRGEQPGLDTAIVLEPVGCLRQRVQPQGTEFAILAWRQMRQEHDVIAGQGLAIAGLNIGA